MLPELMNPYRVLDADNNVVEGTDDQARELMADIDRRRVGRDDVGPVTLSTIFFPLPSFCASPNVLEWRWFETRIMGAPQRDADDRACLGMALHESWEAAESFHRTVIGALAHRQPIAHPRREVVSLVQFLRGYIEGYDRGDAA